jgi:hypothetical protein
MSRLSAFLNNSILAIHHASQCTPHTLSPAAARVCAAGSLLRYFSAFLSFSFFRSLENISHLCSAGCHLLHWTHGFVPSDIF